MTLTIVSGLWLATSAAGISCSGELKSKPRFDLVVYSETGEPVGTLAASGLGDHIQVAACNDALQMVKIVVDGREVWVDRAAVDLRAGGAKKPACIVKAGVDRSDRNTAAVAGIGESCEP